MKHTKDSGYRLVIITGKIGPHPATQRKVGLSRAALAELYRLRRELACEQNRPAKEIPLPDVILAVITDTLDASIIERINARQRKNNQKDD